MNQDKTLEQIIKIKKRYGSDLLILGHYYMHPDILSITDIVGDSYQLSLKASQAEAAEIIFCGVFFMAESARILCKKEQRVLIPDTEAGCPLADTITAEYFQESMEELSEAFGSAPVPVLYVNSSAELKSLVGKSGGICCTSANAAVIIEKILKAGKRVFFLPDQNLGWNVSKSLGLNNEDIALTAGKRGIHSISTAIKIILWDGYCPIHQRFSLKDVQNVRSQYPGCRILVHPECTPQVVEASDFSGSTSQMFKYFEKAEPGSILFIGTEINFVRWLKKLRTDIAVHPLRESRCVNMSKITPQKLLLTLLALSEKDPLQEVFVEDEIAGSAREALRRMIQYVEERK